MKLNSKSFKTDHNFCFDISLRNNCVVMQCTHLTLLLRVNQLTTIIALIISCDEVLKLSKRQLDFLV